MPRPLVISTWPFGKPANDSAWRVLESNGIAIDAIEAGIMHCEDDPSVTSVGYGGLPDASGEVTLDASIVDHDGRCGAVGCLKRVKNAIHAARLVMEKSPHVLLVGEGATQFAAAHGMKEQDLLTDHAKQEYAKWKQQHPDRAKTSGHDTIGMLAIDVEGRLSGGCSTSGLAYKLPGRVGDSPIIGAGLCLEPGVGAATATGVGEEMIRVSACHAIVENLRKEMDPQDAIRDVLQRIHARRGNEAGDVSFLALRADGTYAGMSLWGKTNFQFAVRSAQQNDLVKAAVLI
jgi:N4-(beta-N-acetylglucosaminyl)-L-asparaginase